MILWLKGQFRGLLGSSGPLQSTRLVWWSLSSEPEGPSTFVVGTLSVDEDAVVSFEVVRE
jgi:hypothetical protein